MDKFEVDAWKDLPLPDLVVADVNDLTAIKDTTIRSKAAPLSFPLSDEDKRDIYFLVKKFQGENEIAGLAAPQLGIPKRVIVFEVKNIYEGQRPFPFSIWINPSFERVGNKTDIDYEECFSVKDFAGPVRRWSSVNYQAYDTDGRLIEGVAQGVAARVIQHETDHLDGKLFIDYVPKDQLVTRDELLKLMEQFKNME
ncbi:peptide deformylase 2-like [Macrosteles quadrilineatus]|uniref:peptide deformylase 2-like n=1 Tax=Macrosteles quadrilineatus TaxID=74068 RepID=UPI0023E236E3|nr:peptide deformylase 2-like [Macrosteles quadrilineatus]